MSEHAEESGPAGESLMEKITEKFHGHDSSSSSDSEGEKPEASSSTVKAKIWRLFGREKPIHGVFGGGKAADVFLWRNKKATAGVIGVATAIWVLFELLEYHLLTLLCHILIVCLVIVFLWANATKFISKTTPHIPELKIPEDFVVDAALGLRLEILCAASLLRNIASGRDLQKFLAVIAGLWVLSIVGKWCNFLTLFYIVFVLVHTIPLIYEKYEDKVDAFGEKAMIEIKKQYAVFEVKVLSKIPRGPLKSKKP